SAAGSASRTCKNPALARASANRSPIARPAVSAAAFKAAMRGPPAPATARTNGRSGSTGLLDGCFACAASARTIGQRGSQTETMRDMIVLHYPFARPAVAATLELQVPARLRDEAEAVARGFRGANAPARRRGAAPSPPSPACGGGKGEGYGTQQKQRHPSVGGGEMQPLAQSQIERVDDAHDGGRRRRPHRLLHGPQGFLALRGLDQDQARRIETERVEAMAMQPAVRAIGAQGMGRHD